MKKILKYFAIASGVLLGIYLIFWTINYGVIRGLRKKIATNEISQAPKKIQQEISLRIVFGQDGERNFSYLPWKEQISVYDLLTEASEKNDVFVEVKEYDFGIMVDSISGYENSSEMAWIYFVNGESEQVSADKMMVQPGDVVEWKYIEPEFY